MGIKELELFTIKIGYSLLVISSNYFLGLGPLRWRAGMQLRVVGVPLACRAAVLPCYRATAGDLPPRTCCADHLLCRSPAVPLACCAARLPCRSPAVPLTCCAGNLLPGTSCAANLPPNGLPAAGLFCEAYGAGFADYGYLYLARVNHLVLNLLCYICRELLGLFV